MNTITLNTVGGPINITEKYLASGKSVDLAVEQSIHDEGPDLPRKRVTREYRPRCGTADRIYLLCLTA